MSPLDNVLMAVSSFLPGIEQLECWKVKGLTPAGVDSLTECYQLTDLDLGWRSVLYLLPVLWDDRISKSGQKLIFHKIL